MIDTTLFSCISQLFQFGKNYRGSYDGECPFYCSYSGYNVRIILI